MKFGAISTTYNVVLGFNSAGDVKSQTIKTLTFQNGQTKFLNYGARLQKNAQFTLGRMEKAEFVELANYLNENIGKAIQIEENNSEYLFTPAWEHTTYYVKVLEVGDFQEEDFSTTRQLFSLTVKVALVGENATDKLNEADSSFIDVCIDIDTVMADYSLTPDYEQDTTPGAPSDDEYWFDTDDFKLYQYDLGTTTWDEIGATGNRWYHTTSKVVRRYNGTTWATLYTVAADNTDYGWKDGVFHWSAFSDISSSGTIPNDYKAGWLNLKSVRPSGRSIDPNKGATIAHKNGFSFSVNNSNVDVTYPFWDFIVTNGIGLFNADVVLYAFKDLELTQWARGTNRENNFTYTDYQFKVEPYALNHKLNWPNTEIERSASRYTNVKSDIIGNTPFSTFGQFKYAELQNISTEPDQVTVTNVLVGSTSSLEINGVVSGGDNDTVTVSKTNYTFTDADVILLDTGDYVLSVSRDNTGGTSNEGEIRVISDFTENPTNYVITLEAGLPDASSLIFFQIYGNSYKFQIDETQCGGFGKVTPTNEFLDTIEVWGLSENEKDLVLLPLTEFFVTDSLNNSIFLRPDVLTDTTKVQEFIELPMPQTSYLKKFTGIWPTLNPLTDKSTGDYVDSLDFNLSGWPPAGYDDDHYRLDNHPQSALYPNKYFYFAKTGTKYSASFNKNLINETSFVTKYYDFLAQHTCYLNSPEYMGENQVIIAHSLAVTHNLETEEQYYNTENVKLCVNMGFVSELRIWKYDKQAYRRHPQGFKIRLRFQKPDGTYIEDDSNWIHEFDDFELSDGGRIVIDGTTNAYGHGFGLNVNNFPRANKNRGFTEDNATLSDKMDYIIAFKEDTLPTIDLRYGDKTYNNITKLIYTYEGTGWDAGISPNEGDIVVLSTQTTSVNFVYEFTGGDLVLITNGNEITDFYGRDLFDISSLFAAGTGNLWGEVYKMEIQIIIKDVSNQYIDQSAPVSSYPTHWKFAVKMYEPPALYAIKETEIIDRPLFASVQGRTDADLLEGVADVSTKLLDTIYPGKYDAASITALEALGNRADWKFRRQFTESIDSNDLLEELLLNLWAVAIFDKDDKLVFKSLDIKDYQLTPSREFDETNVLENSIKNPVFRKANQIFQKFNLKYNYFPPAKYSNDLREYQSKTVVSRDEGDAELRALLEVSQNLYNIENEADKEFIYHYLDNDSGYLALTQKVIEFFAYNNWRIKFRIALDEILGASNELELFDVISLKHSFFTDDAELRGFVTMIQPNFHEGYVELEIYIPRPPGVLGSYCDFFKDALFMPERGVDSDSPDADFINTANDFPRVSTDSDDANDFPRNFTC